MDPRIVVWNLGKKYGSCSVDTGIPVCILEIYCEIWDSSLDRGTPVWILVLESGFWDRSVDPRV